MLQYFLMIALKITPWKYNKTSAIDEMIDKHAHINFTYM